MRRRALLVGLAAVVALAVAAPAGLADLVGTVLHRPAGDDGVITLLVLGSDAGPSPRSNRPLASNADGFHLVFVSKNRRHASIVDIPRDSYVSVPGRGQTKINSCLAAGPGRCVATVESNFGVDVDDWVVLTMRGFAKAMNAFGGLTVDVDHPVYDGGKPVRETGKRDLDGWQLLAYARDRKNRPAGDFTRSGSQARVMKLAHRKVVDDGSVDGVMRAVGLMRRYALTSASPARLVTYAFTALRLPPKNVERVILPGGSGPGPASAVILDGRSDEIIRRAKDGNLDG